MDGFTSSRRGSATARKSGLLDQAIDYLTKATGKRPVGYRAPSWAFSASTLDLIQKKGFSTTAACRRWTSRYEISVARQEHGHRRTGDRLTLTETPYLGQNGHMPSPELLYQLYQEEFDGAYEEGTLFVLTLHPHSERASRADAAPRSSSWPT